MEELQEKIEDIVLDVLGLGYRMSDYNDTELKTLERLKVKAILDLIKSERIEAAKEVLREVLYYQNGETAEVKTIAWRINEKLKELEETT